MIADIVPDALMGDEFDFIMGYIVSIDVTDLTILKQDMEIIKALWTAYCIHENLHVDTAEYDARLKKVWSAICHKTVDNFENYMCEFLV